MPGSLESIKIGHIPRSGVRIGPIMGEDGGRFLGGMEATAIDRPFGE